MLNQTSYDDQIKRVRNKLEQARLSDPELKVFGSSSHKYQIGPPVDPADISSFEQKYGFGLPLDYVAFLTRVGNGAPDKGSAAAGPFYGIDPLDRDFVAIGGAASLPQEPLVHPNLSDREWQEESGRLYADDEELSDKEYDCEYERLYAGLLTIGHQGCQSHHALVVTGPNKGRVVNVDTDGNKPRFAFERNFLDWYERWLDEVISGGLLQRHVGWFGYCMGGDDRHLIHVYDQTTNEDTKFEAIKGLIKLVRVDHQTCQRLDQICDSPNQSIRDAALNALTKFDVSLAQPHLEKLACASDADRLAACQSVYWYAKQSCSIIAKHLMQNLERINDDETFRFALYVLKASGVDFTDAIKPFATHTNQSIRVTSLYYLGNAPDKANYVDVFLDGLQDEATSVVHATLQALGGVTDERLLPAYKQVAERFQTDEGYVRTNLEHRLREIGYKSLEAYERGDNPSTPFEWRRPISSLLARLNK